MQFAFNLKREPILHVRARNDGIYPIIFISLKKAPNEAIVLPIVVANCPPDFRL